MLIEAAIAVWLLAAALVSPSPDQIILAIGGTMFVAHAILWATGIYAPAASKKLPVRWANKVFGLPTMVLLSACLAARWFVTPLEGWVKAAYAVGAIVWLAPVAILGPLFALIAQRKR